MTGFETLGDPATLAVIAAVFLIAGAAIGVLAGLFGVGGGGISVPVFFEAFLRLGIDDDIAMPLAVGTSLAMMIPTSINSVRNHHKRGTVDLGILKAWTLPILFGVALGSVLARFGDAWLFQIVFVLVAGANAYRLLLSSGSWRVGDAMPGRLGTSAYGVGIGVLSSLMGVGGGVISNVILTMHGMSMVRAVSTSAGVGVLIAIPGTIGYFFAGLGKEGLPFDALGYVSLLGLVLTAPMAVLTTRIGVTLAHRLPKELLSRLFGIFLALVSLRFLVALIVG